LKEPKAKAQNHELVEKQVAQAVEKQATNVVEPAAPIAPPPAPSRFVGREVGRMKEAFEMVGGNDESALFRSKDYGLAVLLHRGLVAGVGVKRLDKNAITKEEAAQILATVEGGSWNAAPGVSLQDRWTNGNGLSAELQLAGRMLGITRPDLVDQAERERKSEHVASVEAGTNRPERLTGTDTPEAARTRQGAVAAKTAIEERRARAAAAREVRLVAFQLQEATNGSPGAQFAVGLRYLRGEGVEANAELARAWLEKSAAQGNDLAKAKIAELVGK
jgi:TPR repeat protein